MWTNRIGFVFWAGTGNNCPPMSRGRGNPLWLPISMAGTGACPYDRNCPQLPVCRENTPWLPIFRAGTEACPYDLNARIFWADTGVRPYDTKFLVRRGNPLWLPVFRAGTGACPYDPKSHQTPGCRGNTPWLPIFRAGTGNKCPQMPDVGVTPCGYPFSGQAQGSAPTTPIIFNCPDVLPACIIGNHYCLFGPFPLEICTWRFGYIIFSVNF